MRPTVLVTGGAGFIGGALIRFLATERPVRAATRQHHGKLPQGVARAVMADLGPSTDWRQAIDGVGVVVHAAARVHVMRDLSSNPLFEFRQVNVEGTRRLAQQAAAAGVRRFIFLSSIKVNGEQTLDRPFTASDPPDPQDAYGISKWEAEQALMAVGESTGMEAVVIRPPLVYGPGVKGNFARLINWAHRGVPLPLGAINNRRSLVSVFNLCDLLATCIEHPKAAGGTFLVSDGEDVSTPDLICRLTAALGREDRLFRVPPRLLWLAARAAGREGIYRRLCSSLQVDMSETRRLLDWEPPMTLDEGLRRTVADSHL